MIRGCVVFICLFFIMAKVLAETASSPDPKTVYLVTYEGMINPVASELFVNAISEANKAKAEALVIQLDTPGGLDTSMRDIIKAMTASEIPVIVHVFPSGGRAASAGAFITLAAHVAAMTPGTHIGAAHPVAMGGEKMDEETKKKVENDAAAYIRTIAKQRGRNAKWAEDAVRTSVSATEKEALELNIIDIITDNITPLLQQMDGREVQLSQKTVVLSTAGASVTKIEIGLRHKILKTISDPNVAYILMLLGTTGLMAELYTGLIFPGVLGGISLILAFYAFQTMPVNYAGVALIFLSVILFVAEIWVTGFGVLAMGSITSLLLGSLMLFDTPIPALRVSPSLLFATVSGVALFLGSFVFLAWQAQRKPPLLKESQDHGGQRGIAQSDLNPKGAIFIHGELWQAEAQETILAGEDVEVIQRMGLTLQVQKVKNREKPK